MITFGDLLQTPNGTDFFGATALRTLGIASVGLVAKRPHWYLDANVQAALSAITTRLSPYKERISYGASAGGHGCIRHAARLGTATTIALCPQWSIDPAECEGHNPGWPQFFQPSLTNMGIRPHHIAGQLFILADLFDPLDKFHAHRLARLNPNAIIINVPLVEHHITPVIAGTENLATLIAACRSKNIPALQKLTRNARKNSERRITALIEKNIERKPGLIYDIMAARPQTNLATTRIGAQHLPTALSHFKKKSAPGKAISYLNSYRHELRDPIQIAEAAIHLSELSSQPPTITTHHGTTLTYDISLSQARHIATHNNPPQTPLKIRIAHQTLSLFAATPDKDIPLHIDSHCHLTPATQPAAFQLRLSSNNMISLQHAGYFLCAEPDGRVVCDRGAAGGWESFRIGPARLAVGGCADGRASAAVGAPD